MKRFLITIALLLSFISVFAQNISGQATYQVMTNYKKSMAPFENDQTMDPKMKAFIEERLKKEATKTFTLSFDRNASLYKEEEKVDLNNTDENGGSWSPYGITISLHKNVKDKIINTQKDLMTKIFVVKDTLQKYNWKLLAETKQIGEYTCHKATAIIPVSKEEKEEYEQEKADLQKRNTSFLTIKEPQPKEITAWYSSEVPVNNGPEGYWGLPGLILELNASDKNFLCSKIIMNPKDKGKIEVPKGQQISKNDYDLIVQEKLKEIESTNFTK